MGLYIACFIVTLSILLAYGKPHRPVTTYFGRVDNNGKLIDRSSPDYGKDIKEPYLSKISGADALRVSVKAWPHVIENGGKVTVLWSGIQNPNAKDFVAYYCPAYDNPKHHLDYFTVDSSLTWGQGYGHRVLVVYNMRAECVFRYYRAGHDYSQLAGESNKISFANGGAMAPLQGHVAMTTKSTEMRVMWNSGEVNHPPVVQYGRTKDLDMSEHEVVIHDYTADSMCQAPANGTGFWHPGSTYDILLKGLQANTKYFYAYGTEEQMSEITEFTTPLSPGNLTSYKFIVYGDMGVDPFPEAVTTANLMVKEIEKNDVKFVYHHGDISYARGYAYIWEQWFKLIEPYATRIPYMVGVGNHEYDHVYGGEKDPSHAKGEGGFRPSWWNSADDSGGECSVPMFKRFHMPDNGNSIFWYSFNYGLVHIIMMSTEHDYSPGSPQYKWIDNDLANVDRKITPWVIIGGHRAMYCSESIAADYVVSINMQRLFEDLLYYYKVDLALWAHYHSYERTCKVYKNKCVDDGITHLTVGSGGKDIDADLWYKKEWSVFHINDYGYGRITVANGSALLFEFIQNRFDKVIDHVWLTK